MMRWFIILLPIFVWLLDDFAFAYLRVQAVNYPFYLKYFLAIVVGLVLVTRSENEIARDQNQHSLLIRFSTTVAFAISGLLVGYLGAAVEYSHFRPMLLTPTASEWDYLGPPTMLENRDMTILHMLFGIPLIVGIKELFFRRVLIGELGKKFSTPVAIFISAGLFALVFWGSGPMEWVSAFVWALLYGFVYVKWRSIKFSATCEWSQAIFWYTNILIEAGY